MKSITYGGVAFPCSLNETPPGASGFDAAGPEARFFLWAMNALQPPSKPAQAASQNPHGFSTRRSQCLRLGLTSKTMP